MNNFSFYVVGAFAIGISTMLVAALWNFVERLYNKSKEPSFKIHLFNYKPGDTVIIKTRLALSQAQMEKLTVQVRRAIDNNAKVLILDPEFDLAVLQTTSNKERI